MDMRFTDIVKSYLGALGFGILTSLSGSSCQPKKADAELPEKPQNTQNIPAQKVISPVLTIEYRTDTLEHETSVLLYYLNGSITRNYIENNNSFKMQLPYFTHEKWHHHNAQTGFRNRFLCTPDEYYKLCMHDEISATMSAILTARYEYLAAENKSQKNEIIKKYENTYMKFYFSEIKNGHIHPESSKIHDIVKERKLIANGTRDLWMRAYAPVYAQRILRMVKNYIGKKGLVEDSKQNYEILRNKMYTIGGVNFASYMDKDIDAPNEFISITENLRKVKSLNKHIKKILPDIEEQYNNLQQIDLAHKQEAFQHIFIAARLKQMLQSVNPQNLESHPQIITSCYQKIVGNLKYDTSFAQFINESAVYGLSKNQISIENDSRYDEFLNKAYTLNGTNLIKYIQNFNKDDLPVTSFTHELTQKSYFPIMPRPTFINDITTNYIQPENSAKQTFIFKSTTKPQTKEDKRISDIQHIDIPNFFEPILTKATPEQEQQIFNMIHQFENVPEVLKSCRTQDIQKFKKENPDYNRFLER